MAFRQFLGGVALAAVDQLVERGHADHRQFGRFGGRAGLAGGEAGVAAHGHERIDVVQRHDACSVESAFEMCCRKRPADRRGDSSLVENISCSRIEPSRRLCDLAISPFSSSVSRVLPPPTSAISVCRWLTPRASPTAWHTAETVSRLSSEVSITSTPSRVAMKTRSRNVSPLAASRTARGGHGPDLLDLVEIEQLAVIAQDADGGPHALAAQPAAAKGVLPQPDRPLKLLQDFDPAVGKDLGDDHPQGVGPDVDGGDRPRGHGGGRVGRNGLHGAYCCHQGPAVKSGLRATGRTRPGPSIRDRVLGLPKSGGASGATAGTGSGRVSPVESNFGSATAGPATTGSVAAASAVRPGASTTPRRPSQNCRWPNSAQYATNWPKTAWRWSRRSCRR